MILAPPFSAFDKPLATIFTAYLRKVGLSFGKVSGSGKLVCRIAETAPKVAAGFRKYSAKQVVKPLSKVQVEGMRI